MSVHSDGTGTGWDTLEALDVDQPHGLDYRESYHLAKAVRKRINKEHVAFGDTTAGGEHKPGGAAIMDIVDASTDISATDGTYIGYDLIYDQTNSCFWCFTADGTAAAADDAYSIMLGPKSICLGADFTWDGAHLFDASCDFSDVAVTGDFTLAGKFAVDGSADFSDVFVEGDLSVAGTLKLATDITITGDMAIDGTANFASTVDFGADATVQIKGQFDLTAEVKLFGDWTTKSTDNAAFADAIVYQVSSDGFVTAYKQCTAGSTQELRVYTDSANPPTTLRQAASNSNTLYASVFSPVKKDHYWRVDITTDGNATIYWITFGDGTC